MGCILCGAMPKYGLLFPKAPNVDVDPLTPNHYLVSRQTVDARVCLLEVIQSCVYTSFEVPARFASRIAIRIPVESGKSWPQDEELASALQPLRLLADNSCNRCRAGRKYGFPLVD